MKKFCFFCLVALALSGCEKDPSIGNDTPVIASGIATNISNTSATINIQITNYGISTREIGVYYSTSKSFTNAERESGGYDCCYITGLTRNTEYYYKAYATNGTDYIFGDVKTFTTLNSSVIIRTEAAYGNGYNSAYDYPYRFNVSVSIIGLDQVVEWGVMVSSNSDFSSCNKSEVQDAGYSEGSVCTQLWGAKSRSLVFCRAYAVLNNGTYLYGVTKSVTAGS